MTTFPGRWRRLSCRQATDRRHILVATRTPGTRHLSEHSARGVDNDPVRSGQLARLSLVLEDRAV